MPPCACREHFRAFAGELPEESELDTYRGFCITGRQESGWLRCVACAFLTRPCALSHHTAYDETQAWIKELCEFVRVCTPLPAAAHFPAPL